jgi:hypothetical protein
VDLRHGRRRERLGIDPCKGVRRQILVEHALDLGKRNGGNLVDELCELIDVDVGKQVGTRGEELTELDVGRPELLERVPELLRCLSRRGSRADDAELPQDAHDSAPASDARDVDRALHTFEPGPHQGRVMPGAGAA